MNLREITIGRNPNCDIYLDPRCKYASGLHGSIYYDGYQLMFKDTSSNGTLINNISIRGRAVPIRPGDSIMIAGKYPLNWNQIISFFPQTSPAQPVSPTGTVINSGVQPLQQPVQPVQPVQPQQAVGGGEALDLSGWSWGAFVLTWIWGFFNGCWWIFLIKLGFILLFALTFWIPFLPIFLGLVNFGLDILYGVKGREWAWKNRIWLSPESFKQTQHTWNMVGLCLFLFGIVVLVLGGAFASAAMSSLFMSLIDL